jgi:hypothetical protein
MLYIILPNLNLRLKDGKLIRVEVTGTKLLFTRNVLKHPTYITNIIF